MSSTRNLFNVIMGSFLRQERGKVQETTKNFSKSLGLGHSLYRMIEAGNACVTPNKVFDLVLVLQEANINIEKLAKFLIGAQLIEKSINNGRNSIESLAELREYNDQDFNEFTSVIIEVRALLDDNDIKVFIDTLGVDELRLFLRDGYTVDEESSPMINNATSSLDNAPSLSYEMIDYLIKWSRRHPPTHISGIAQNWENENAPRFLELHSIYLDEEIVISKDNLSRFDFSYLKMKEFRRCKMVFVSENSPEVIKNRFYAMLDECRVENGKQKLTEYEKNKIVIKTMKNQNKKVRRLLAGEGSFINRELLACWVFTTIDGYHIGFTGCEKVHLELVINLSIGESYKRYQELSKLF